jgi:hypothetical protein
MRTYSAALMASAEFEPDPFVIETKIAPANPQRDRFVVSEVMGKVVECL